MKYYFIGIKGAGMSALALVLNDLGYEVIGYDDEEHHQFTEDKLIERGIKIYTTNEYKLDKETFVVKSTAIKDDHPEVLKAKELELKIVEYNEMLGKVANIFDLITVAGCHGKTTTTSLMAHVLTDLEGCNYLIGDGTGYAKKENKKFVIEACEYCRHFLVYKPKYAIITNIELDHVDYFKDLQDVIDAYSEYANNTEKMIIACGDDPYTHLLDTNKPIFYYGIKDDNDIVARDLQYTEHGISFDVFVEDNYYGHFDLPFYGKHMVFNSLAVIAICYYERVDAKELLKSMKTFKGAQRRAEETKIGETILVDDYAHHPTEIKALIKGMKQKYPNKKIVGVFQPHTFSRTQEFTTQIADALNLADSQYVLDIFPAREKQEDFPDVKSENIVKLLNKGKLISDDTWDLLKEEKDSVILFMSPKQIHNIMESLKTYLNEEEKED